MNVLAVASVIGRDFELDLLATMLGVQDINGLLKSLEPAIRESLVSRQDAQTEFQFSHSLVRQAIYQTLPADRRAELHAACGSAIEALRSRQNDDYAGRLAVHFERGLSVAGADQAIRYSLQAGKQTLSELAFDEAQDMFRRAFEVQGDREGLATAEVLEGLSKAAVGAGGWERPEQANVTFQQLWRPFDIYAAVGERDAAIRVASFPMFTFASRLIEPLDRALRLVRAGSREEGMLLTRRAQAVASSATSAASSRRPGQATGPRLPRTPTNTVS